MSRTPGREGITEWIGSRSSTGATSASGKANTFLDVKSLSELGSDCASNDSVEALVCARCLPLEELVKAYEADMVTMGQKIQELEDQLAGRERQLRREGATVIALQRKLSNSQEQAPDAEAIRGVLAHWMQATGRLDRRGRKPNVDVSGKRGDIVRKALKLPNVRTGNPYTPDELCRAVTGLGLKPFANKQGRQPTAVNGARRWDDIEYALRDEPTIDKFAAVADAADAVASTDGMFEMWQRAAAHQALLADVVLTEFARQDGIDVDALMAVAA